ncbi:MAG: 2-oxo acid dehydrogenase subunit E2 [Clostridiales Family XIII bacterium]|jgi:pyruvate dehydrogenase E2 component (dihydrolipoamide acetyltransferase)|nr:2-oxo acid dehydrogenase subunit E2 [Clostridiales Family XIII bacterium]
MGEKLKITPRARRALAERGLDTAAIAAADIKGSGFQGGITEGDLLAWLGSGGGAVSVDGPVAALPGGASEKRATPLARAIARAEGLDLAGAAGSGLAGKIMKADVLSLLAGGSASGKPAAADIGRNGDKRIAKATPYSGIRKVIGNRLAESKFTAPHLYFTQKVDLTETLALRAKINKANADEGIKTSVTDYIAKAVVLTLQTYPELNASLAGETIEQYASVNLGIAVAAPGGLIVPNIKETQDLGLLALSGAAQELFAKARDGKLKPAEYNGGTFTISNLGMFGIENFTAIINPPESGILAVSATKDEVVVIAGSDGKKSMEIRPMMNITLSVDHRLIDGLLAAQFVTEVKRLLENPIELLCDLKNV